MLDLCECQRRCFMISPLAASLEFPTLMDSCSFSPNYFPYDPMTLSTGRNDLQSQSNDSLSKNQLKYHRLYDLFLCWPPAHVPFLSDCLPLCAFKYLLTVKLIKKYGGLDTCLYHPSEGKLPKGQNYLFLCI